MSSYWFSPVNWAGQEPGTSGTSHINNAAGKGKRAKTRARGGQTAQPLQGQTHSTTDFELVSNMMAALLAGDAQAATALVNLGSRAPQSVATGRLAAHGKR
jgi:hypothetical protein